MENEDTNYLQFFYLGKFVDRNTQVVYAVWSVYYYLPRVFGFVKTL